MIGTKSNLSKLMEQQTKAIPKKTYLFSETIYKEGYNYLVSLPYNVSKNFKTSNNIPVRGTINGIQHKATLVHRKNNNFVLFLNAEIRKKANLTDNDTVHVSLEYDPEPRIVNTPDDVQLIFKENMKVWNTYDAFSDSRKREIVNYITEAKKAETRLNRIEKMAQRIEEMSRRR